MPYSSKEQRNAWRRSPEQRQKNAAHQAKYRAEQDRLHQLHVLLSLKERLGRWPGFVSKSRIEEIEQELPRIERYRQTLWAGRTEAVEIKKEE